ncbi:unnamed protein product [Polarella glacialis]|uniref:RING-type domain-containing protein n=1 Tax=Polarella glacialis TaxID=89957 RepID=A0A813I3C7_POLGL|nr:unnamed protein product [Polarella glacialis]
MVRASLARTLACGRSAATSRKEEPSDPERRCSEPSSRYSALVKPRRQLLGSGQACHVHCDLSAAVLWPLLAVTAIACCSLPDWEPSEREASPSSAEPVPAVNLEGGTCAICLEEVASAAACHAGLDRPAARLSCGHVFHADCVGKWIQMSASCPFRCHSVPGALDTAKVPTNLRTGEEQITEGSHDACLFLASSSRRSAALAALQRALGAEASEAKAKWKLYWLRW